MNIIADTEKVALTIIKEYDIINKMNVIYNDNIKSGIIEIKINMKFFFSNLESSLTETFPVKLFELFL